MRCVNQGIPWNPIVYVYIYRERERYHTHTHTHTKGLLSDLCITRKISYSCIRENKLQQQKQKGLYIYDYLCVSVKYIFVYEKPTFMCLVCFIFQGLERELEQEIENYIFKGL